jgi:hypothetical protein
MKRNELEIGEVRLTSEGKLSIECPACGRERILPVGFARQIYCYQDGEVRKYTLKMVSTETES